MMNLKDWYFVVRRKENSDDVPEIVAWFKRKSDADEYECKSLTKCPSLYRYEVLSGVMYDDSSFK